MSVYHIDSVVRDPADPRLTGQRLERPSVGAELPGSAFELSGWVVGAGVPAVAVEVLHGDRVVARSPVRARPDVAAAFPDVAHAERSGYRVYVRLLGMGTFALELRAVLADQDRVPLASLAVVRRWRDETYHVGAPLVSVIIPCYDQAHFLHEAIESVAAQTWPHLECIVVDDGSHDNTGEVASRYPGVRLVRQENRGLSAARNTGIRHSGGAYLVFLDADDRLLPDALADGLAAMAEHPEAAFVAGRWQAIDHDGRVLDQQPVEPDPVDITYEELLKGNVIWMGATVMYRRPVFSAVGVFDESLEAAYEYDWMLRAASEYATACHGHPVATVHRPENLPPSPGPGYEGTALHRDLEPRSKDPSEVIHEADALEAYLGGYFAQEGLTFAKWIVRFSGGFYRERNEIMADLLVGLSPRTVLEFACAGPFLAQLLVERVDSIDRYTCSNFSPEMLQYCADVLKDDDRCEVKLIDADVSRSPDMHRDRIRGYDTFITTSLEHIQFDRELVQQFPTGSRFVFSVARFDDPEHFRVFETETHIRARYGDLLDILEVRDNSEGNKYVVAAVRNGADQPDAATAPEM